MSIELKIKIKSLADEARTIRKEENKLPGPQRGSLRDHRVGVVRREARHSLLAYGYLRGVPYRAMEATTHTDPEWKSVERMIKKYGPPNHETSLDDWRKNEQTKSLCSGATGPQRVNAG